MPRLIDADALLQKGVWTVTVGDIKNAPTIDLSEQAKRDIATILENEMDMRVIAERKHGKWIKHPGHVVHEEGALQWKYDDIFECSLCGCKVKEASNYCPNCGAKMEI